MPMYEYKAGDGEIIERFYHMTDDHPETLTVDGKVYGRVWGVFRKDADRQCDQYPYASVRLAGKIDEKDAEHKNVTVRGVPHENLPIIRSKAHERELCDKYRLERE